MRPPPGDGPSRGSVVDLDSVGLLGVAKRANGPVCSLLLPLQRFVVEHGARIVGPGFMARSLSCSEGEWEDGWPALRLAKWLAVCRDRS